VNAGYETSKLIKGHALKTRVPGVMSGFGGLFELPGMPIFAGTDGVGALADKLKRRRQNMARAIEKSDIDLRSSLLGGKA
jgi:phosphoribosylaminoimidazole (AIR) synthetase